AINVAAPAILARSAGRHLVEQGSGKIINIASTSGILGKAVLVSYSASKGAVMAWTRSVAHEWGPSGVTVNAIVPAIWTPMYDAWRSSLTVEELKITDEGFTIPAPKAEMAPVELFT
ncbi:MAG: SDR family NAD(P)-dependent oxidoreductase, partial [Candidatus Krumholzibacteriota bacterium]|nr:SDR family NAD(P)-dependent oxidoreductase [Candidatus Krumholzibacteriota bacterium]